MYGCYCSSPIWAFDVTHVEYSKKRKVNNNLFFKHLYNAYIKPKTKITMLLFGINF